MGNLASEPSDAASRPASAGGHFFKISGGIVAPPREPAFFSGAGAGVSPKCGGKVFCKNRRNECAVVKMRSVARSGSIPHESTASKRTFNLFAAAATMRGKKKQ